MTAHPRLTAAIKFLPLLGQNASGLAGACLVIALCALPGQALAINDDAVLRRMDTVLEENIRLHDEAWKARKNGTEAAKHAQDAVAASDERLEKTRAEALAHVAGVSPAQVEGLRRDGRSWGQAAGELGVHPGFLGVGKAPLYEAHAGRKAAAEPQAKTKRGKKAQMKSAKQPAPEKIHKQKKSAKPTAAAKPTKTPAGKKKQKKSGKDS